MAHDLPPLNIGKSELYLPDFHPKQRLAFETLATEYLYGGATRGGKSFGTRLCLIAWSAAVKGLQSDIFRLNFDDVIGNHMEGPGSFPDLLKQWEKDGLVEIVQTEVRFTFNGSLISLEHCANEKVLQKHQGIAKHVRVLEEATQIRERYIRWLRAWVSMPMPMKELLPDQLRGLYPQYTDEQLKDFFPRIIYNSNPIGQSAGYFRREFVKAKPRYEIWRAPDSEGGFLRQYIPAKVEDNPSEDALATHRRVSGMGDSAISQALLNEDWDAPVGDFIRQWDEAKHRVPDHMPPSYYFKFRSYDWGGADPAACMWFYVSDGQEFTYQGVKHWYPKGALVGYREWYICDDEDQSKGCDMPNADMARGMVDRTTETSSNITVTDSLPFQLRGGELMADIFARNGCPLTRGNTSRELGWKVMKDRLTGKDGFPMLYFTQSCKYAAEYIPMLQRHKTKPEDAEESGEATHICFIASTLVRTPEGPRAIDELRAGDVVIAGDGISRRISCAGLTQEKAKVIKLEFTDGETVICTPDHKFLTRQGWLKACDCMGLAIIVGECESTRYQKVFKSLTGENTDSTQNSYISPVAATDYIEKSGSIITDLSRKGLISTISTVISLTTRLKILNWFRLKYISISTGRMRDARQHGRDLINIVTSRQNGTGRKMAGHGIVINTAPLKTNCISLKSLYAIIAERVLSLLKLTLVSVPLGVSSEHIEKILPTIESRGVNAAIGSSKHIHGGERLTFAHDRAVQYTGRKRVLSVSDVNEAHDVYCLTEPVSHSFQLASGLVVSNCDLIRLACMTQPPIKTERQIVAPKFGTGKVSNTPANILKKLKRHQASQYD